MNAEHSLIAPRPASSVDAPRPAPRGEAPCHFLQRPLAGQWPYLWLDAVDLHVHGEATVTAIIATGVNHEGRRETLGLELGPLQDASAWAAFFTALRQRGLQGVSLVMADAHPGLKTAAAQSLEAGWQYGHAHFLRRLRSHAPGASRTVAARLRQGSLLPQPNQARAHWCRTSGELQRRYPQVASLMNEYGDNLMAFLCFPARHRRYLYSSSPQKLLLQALERRGPFANVTELRQQVGSTLLTQHKDWQQGRRYLPAA